MAFVLIKVVKILDSVYFYSNCIICGGRIEIEGNLCRCRKCFRGSKKESIKFRYRLHIQCCDDTGYFPIAVFGRGLTNLFGLEANEFIKFTEGVYSTRSKEEVEELINASVNRTFVNGQFLVSFHVRKKLPCHTLKKVCEVNGDCPASHDIKRATFESNRITVSECFKQLLQDASQNIQPTCSATFQYDMMRSLTIPQSLMNNKQTGNPAVKEANARNNSIIDATTNDGSFLQFFQDSNHRYGRTDSFLKQFQTQAVADKSYIDNTFLNFSERKETPDASLNQTSSSSAKWTDQSLTDLWSKSTYNPLTARKHYIDRSADLFLDSSESSSFLTNNSLSTNETFNSYQTFTPCNKSNYSLSTSTPQYHPNINSPDLFADSTTDSFAEITINEEN
ncbi:DgyrCDS10129 [Dimorphilus gyrociliatus]|uniref:DgyrCDS10129 n=1 Tax=Dimorphilus gyrociliatus TaxID=2664684 RepID=A0A7I8W0H4_9ANNE|nr:DgyrCDS10129 [Dimorphilus gyrociliatus]